MDKDKRSRIQESSREEVESVQRHVKASKKLLGRTARELHEGAEHLRGSNAALKDSVSLLKRRVRRT